MGKFAYNSQLTEQKDSPTYESQRGCDHSYPNHNCDLLGSAHSWRHKINLNYDFHQNLWKFWFLNFDYTPLNSSQTLFAKVSSCNKIDLPLNSSNFMQGPKSRQVLTFFVSGTIVSIFKKSSLSKSCLIFEIVTFLGFSFSSETSKLFLSDFSLRSDRFPQVGWPIFGRTSFLILVTGW